MCGLYSGASYNPTITVVDININQLDPTHIHKLRQLRNHKLKKQTLTADHKRVTRSRPISTL